MKKFSTFLVIVMLACMHASSLPVNTPFYFFSPSAGEQIRSNLYIVSADATTTLMDGSLTQYDLSYTNAVDGMDARKMSNFSENIGMIRGTTTLVIERRHTIDVADTIFYKLWNVQQRNYQFEFITSSLNHPGLTGYLEDSYLHTTAALNLNGSNYINFSVTSDPASAAMYRFRIIFETATPGALPVTFTSLKAYQKNNIINVDWKTENESNVKSYTIEKSSDGKRFENVSDVSANNLPANSYSWTDVFPAEGFNYYRILSNDIDGKMKYSEVLKVLILKEGTSIKVFPNPITGNTIHLQLINRPAGLYEVKLINNSGQVVMTKQIQHEDGSSTETIRPSQLIPKGMYQLEVTKPDRSKSNIHLMY